VHIRSEYLKESVVVHDLCFLLFGNLKFFGGAVGDRCRISINADFVG